MRRLLTLLSALCCVQMLSAQSAATARTVVCDNDTLRIEVVSVPDPYVPGQPRYETDRVNIYNKLDRPLTVEYQVQATLTRYDKTFVHRHLLQVEPRSAVGEDILSNYSRRARYHESDCRVVMDYYRYRPADRQD